MMNTIRDSSYYIDHRGVVATFSHGGMRMEGQMVTRKNRVIQNLDPKIGVLCISPIKSLSRTTINFDFGSESIPKKWHR